MLNKEKYAKEIVDIALVGGNIAIIDDKPVMCDGIVCGYCTRENGNWECDDDRKILQAWANSEYKERILTNEEKAYLSAVIKPFRNDVKNICKYYNASEWITIAIKNGPSMEFPHFVKGAMYKGMKGGKKYLLEELGL